MLGHDPPYGMLMRMSHATYVYDVVKLVSEARTKEDVSRISADTQRWVFSMREKGWIA